MTTTHHLPPPVPPPADRETLTAAHLAAGLIVIVRVGHQPVLKTVESVTPNRSERHPKLTVRFTDATTVAWAHETRVSVVADSLPASYWRGKCTSLRHQLAAVAIAWHREAITLRKPNPDGGETPAERQARARQARLYVNQLAGLIGLQLGQSR